LSYGRPRCILRQIGRSGFICDQLVTSDCFQMASLSVVPHAGFGVIDTI